MTADSLQNDNQPAPVSVTVTAQYIKDMSFENPNAPQILVPSEQGPDISMGVNLQTRGVGDNAHEVVLVLKLEAKMGDKIAFITELSYAGVFILPVMPQEHVQMFLFIEAPRLLFPFARSILANAVRDGGFPHVMINPIDFAGLYASNKTQIGTMPTIGAA